MVRGVERRILLDNETKILDSLMSYRADDLPVGDDFEAGLANRFAAAV
jgi:hypothetical protein